MSEPVGRLLVYTKDRALGTLAQGISASLNLAYIPLVDNGDIGGLRESTQPSAAIIHLTSADCGQHAAIRSLAHDLSMPVVVVMDEPNPNVIIHAIRGGAISCLSMNDAMHTLLYDLENVLRSFGDRNQNRLVPIAGRVLLRLPDSLLSDGCFEERLAPIPTRLLVCLASKSNIPVSHGDLIEAAWGRKELASVHTLHQQVHVLREAMAVLGIDHLLRTIRGYGYMLAVSDLPSKKQ